MEIQKKNGVRGCGFLGRGGHFTLTFPWWFWVFVMPILTVMEFVEEKFGALAATLTGLFIGVSVLAFLFWMVFKILKWLYNKIKGEYK